MGYNILLYNKNIHFNQKTKPSVKTKQCNAAGPAAMDH